ncbi:YceI family protein [Chryseolinea lacunae]|uniref:YceI family protein n=1 Tax=Chryseolinea lacunae TaxID=2801331 RepID=A0ABS1KTA0_9BACT|nr:YceI family protein [Chryseolinea lacunae]MBL0742694.1 YceI family protein [Chryseolinea lacunae]
MYSRFILGLVCVAATLTVVKAQTVYTIRDSKELDMKLSGTSTLHKWSMNTKTLTGSAQFSFAPGHQNQIDGIHSLTMKLDVLSLTSDEKALDRNAYKALKTDQFKNISYTLISAKVSPEKDHTYHVVTTGNLEIAGVTNKVAMDVFCVVNADATITCSGSDQLKMTDYNVKPPSFMLGAMRTGDDITLDFTVVYTK